MASLANFIQLARARVPGSAVRVESALAEGKGRVQHS